MTDRDLTLDQVMALAQARTSINHGGLIEFNAAAGVRWYGAHMSCGGIQYCQSDIDRLVDLGLLHRTGQHPNRRAQITEHGLMELDLRKAAV